jgi:hypothetical protein
VSKDIEQISRKILNDAKIEALPTFDDDKVVNADFDANDEEHEVVPEDIEQAPYLEDGDQVITKKEFWTMMEEYTRHNEQHQAFNMEPPPHVPETSVQAVDRVSDSNTLTATQTIASTRVGSERASASGSRAPSGVQNSACGANQEDRRYTGDRRERRDRSSRRPNGDDDGNGDGGDDPNRRSQDKDKKEERDRRSRKGPPGGDGGGDGDPDDDGGGDGVPSSDDERLPIRVPRCRPGDSEDSCSDRSRSTSKQNMAILLQLPKSAAQLDNYQFAIKNQIALVSGRYDRRTAWID